MVTACARVANGQFVEAGHYEVAARDGCVVVRLSDMPNFRTDRYDGNGGIRPATADEIAAYDAAQPKFLNTRDLIRRMTSAEVFFLQSAASQDADACHFWTKLITDNMTDVHSPEWEQGVAFFVPSGVQAGVWPDTATAQARVAVITA